MDVNYGKYVKRFSELSVGTSNIINELHDLIELAEALNTKLNLTGTELSADWSAKYLEETKEQLTKNNTYLSFLNTNTIREELMPLMKLLNLKGMVLYIVGFVLLLIGVIFIT